jgi:hypothetical protein
VDPFQQGRIQGFTRNLRLASCNRSVKRAPQHAFMSDSDHIENRRLRGLVALLSGAVALVTVGALAVLYTVDLGADVMLAVLAAVTLAAAP